MCIGGLDTRGWPKAIDIVYATLYTETDRKRNFAAIPIAIHSELRGG
jgi:hypothetical protein